LFKNDQGKAKEARKSKAKEMEMEMETHSVSKAVGTFIQDFQEIHRNANGTTRDKLHRVHHAHAHPTHHN
jgi:hypothetical protein